jgi:YidC/Oxa1 family membrane protein insertase
MVLGACTTAPPASPPPPGEQLESVQPTNIWGWLRFGLEWLLNTLFDFTNLIHVPSYALAILLFTIIVKLILQPLMGKQLRSTRKMAKIQPKIKELQEKYKGNPQKMQEMQMALYKEHNVNPMAGCLPLLIQMPILWALFQTLRNFIPTHPEFYGFLWIKPPEYNYTLEIWENGLGNPDPTGFVLAAIVAVTMFAQQYVSTVNKEDKTQKMMLYAMPLFFAVMTRSLPAGLSLYWIFYSIVGTVIQVIFNRSYAKEEAREEALEAERKAAEEAEKKKNKKNNKGNKNIEAAPFAENQNDETQNAEVDKKIKDNDHPYSTPVVYDSDYSRPLSDEMASKQRHSAQRKKLKRKK